MFVYEGLKWQRQQAEAAARKQAGRCVCVCTCVDVWVWVLHAGHVHQSRCHQTSLPGPALPRRLCPPAPPPLAAQARHLLPPLSPPFTPQTNLVCPCSSVVMAGCERRMSKEAKAAAAAAAAWQYAAEGPPDAPAFDADAEASAAVAELLQADLVLTTYDVLQQVGGCMCVWWRHVCARVEACICVLAGSPSCGVSGGRWGHSLCLSHLSWRLPARCCCRLRCSCCLCTPRSHAPQTLVAGGPL